MKMTLRSLSLVILAAGVACGACGVSGHAGRSAAAATSPRGSGAGVVGVTQTAPPTDPKSPAKSGPLFVRLGGEPAVTAVVDAFLKRVAADKRINGRFINTDLTRLRTLLVQFVSHATGGPVEYTGRDMHAAHAGLQIVAEEFDALVGDLAGALAELKVPAAEQNELLGALGPLKSQVVNAPPPESAAHDPARAREAREVAKQLRAGGGDQAADLLEIAVTARVRGQRSYAEQLYSAAERMLPAGRLDSLQSLFREGAPERIASPLKQMPADTPPQPKLAVGSSEEEAESPKVESASLTGKLIVKSASADRLGVIALDPVGHRASRRTPKQRIMEQRDREFAPRLLAVPVGSTVSFPNFDPIYHNVFSLSPGRSFDLGIYKNGESRDVTFTKEGLIRLGCNLHANMTAHVVVVAASHYAVTTPAGRFTFKSIPPGKYALRAWSEDNPDPVARVVKIHPGANTLTLSIAGGKAQGLGTDKFGNPRGDDR